MRKTKIVTIENEGRDRGKSFLITEMDAMRAEKWAFRAMLAMGRSGIDIPDDALTSGAIGIMSAGISSIARLPFEEAQPLLDDMMECVTFAPDLSRRNPMDPEKPITRPLVTNEQLGDADIQEVPTLLRLRKEVAELHLGFSLTAALSSLAAQWLTSRQQPTPTSPKPADQSLQEESPA